MNDLRMAKDIHKKFGQRELKTFPMCGMLKYKIIIDISKACAENIHLIMWFIINRKRKNFFMKSMDGQNTRINIMKMCSPGFLRDTIFLINLDLIHENVASNEILAGTLTRDEALRMLEQPPYDPDQMQQDKEYVAKKLGISVEEFDSIIESPCKTPADYKNSMWMIKLGAAISKMLGMENRNLRI